MKVDFTDSALRSFLFHSLVLIVLGGPLPAASAGEPVHAPASRAGLNRENALRYVRAFDFEALRLAINDLTETFGPKYPGGREYSQRLEHLARASRTALTSIDPNDAAAKANLLKLARELEALRYDALLSNPLLDFDKLLLLKRKRGQLGLPVNHKCNSGIERTGYDNEIAVLSPVRPGGKLQTLFRPAASEYVGEIDLDYDAEKLLFTMPKGPTWQIFEIRADGTGLRQVSPGDQPDVDNFDACYLPDGRIAFASTASFTAIPCWHGVERACNLYRMDADGGNVRQLCFDQDLDLHPSVLPTGQIIFSRWDYTGPMHIYLRPLMVMNPDGTGQRAVYGSNSYWPNALYFPRGIPGAPGKIIAVIAGYHGVPRMGELGLLDTTKGWHEAAGVVQKIPGRGKPVRTVIRDKLVDKSWPKFLHPYPLSDKYFLVASEPNKKSSWGIYLVDVFDNMLPICVQPKFDFFEPIPLTKGPRPPIIPDKMDLSRDNAIVYIDDVYAGAGLTGVPRGVVKKLRVLAYEFGYPGMAGPDKVGCGGPWEAMRILGTVDVQPDGSAMFSVPADTPLSVQPLDKEDKAVQLMRSWFTAMPGETVSCVGCHEQPNSTPVLRQSLAAKRPPARIEPWYGPARGFDFGREVQPVLDKYCVGCHDGASRPDGRKILDLRAKCYVKNYQGRELTKLAAARLHPALRKALGGTKVKYTPAYEALIPYIRRVNIEDDVHLLVPGEYHADTNELIQMLHKGHYNVQLDEEAWDRLVTWIDLNGPCHGTWGQVGPIPEGADRRRQELRRLYGGPSDDPEAISQMPVKHVEPVSPQPIAETKQPAARYADWTFDADEARRRQNNAGPIAKTIDLGGGVTMKLVRIPAGRFVMGDSNGEPDERPPAEVSISDDFWMGACEVTNAQYHRFDPAHNSGYFMKRYQGPDGPGLSLDEPEQPVVRVSWRRAVEFCEWLSKQTGMNFTLPTEAQWEYACRAGSRSAFSYGGLDADFSRWANVADKSLSVSPGPTGGLESNIVAYFGTNVLTPGVYGGDILCDIRFDDGCVATADVGSYQPNAWGLYDMHGNACEWTRTTYKPYPYRTDDGRDSLGESGRKVVRGGSWRDRPKRCRSAFRLSYPAWQRVFNVGFRVVCEIESSQQKHVAVASGRPAR
jgi:formylglycine-generating enzyme required for sulfatase activity